MMPLPPQLHLLNLFAGEESPYEGLHAMVSSAMKPWFEAFVSARGANKDGDGKLGKFKFIDFPRNSPCLPRYQGYL
jgi:hypothetical protein